MLRLSLVTLALTTTTSFAQERATFRALGDLEGGDFHSEALAVSPDGGTVAGQGARVADSQGLQAFTWSADGGFRPVEPWPAGPIGSQPRAVDDAGATIVGNTMSTTTMSRAFAWTRDGGVELLADLDGGDPSGGALDVSTGGKVIVGWNASARGLEAVRWVDRQPLPMGDLPGGPFQSAAAVVSRDGTVIAGTGTTVRGRAAFRWTEGTGLVSLGDLPGGAADSEPFGMSADGSAIVGRGTSGSGTEAFLWTAGSGMQGLGDLPGGSFASIAFDVSADGQRVVGSGEGEHGSEAFVWEAATGMQSLRAVLVAAGAQDLNDWRLEVVNAISDDGRTLVGAGTDPHGHTQAWVAVLPRARTSGDARGR